MKFRLLGKLVIQTETGELTLDRRRERCLLGILLLHNNTAIPAERLTYLLWDGDPVPSARRQLHSHVSRIRRTLRGTPARLRRVGGAYGLDVDDAEIDARVFAMAVAHARAVEDPATRCELLRAALDLWTGDILVDALSPWLRPLLVSDLEELRGCVTEEWLAAGVAAGAHTELLPELIRMARVEPTREVIIGLSMRVLHRMGRDADALELFQEHRASRADQFGLDPGHELQELQLQLLRGEPVPTPGHPAPVEQPDTAVEDLSQSATPAEDDLADRTATPDTAAPSNLPVLWKNTSRLPVPVTPAPSSDSRTLVSASDRHDTVTPLGTSLARIGSSAGPLWFRLTTGSPRRGRRSTVALAIVAALFVGLVSGLVSARGLLPTSPAQAGGDTITVQRVAPSGPGAPLDSSSATFTPTATSTSGTSSLITTSTIPATPTPSALSSGSSPSAPRLSTADSPSSLAAGPPAATDEFSAGAVPDSAKWNVYSRTDVNGGLWSPSAVRVADGELRIDGSGRNPTGAGNVSGGLCWCGYDGDQLYGIWQVRAKFDPGAGYGPVIALWPKTDRASDGFISVAQAFQPDRRAVKGSTFWNNGMADGQLDGFFAEWHVYTVEWRASSVRISVDDTLLYDSASTPGFVAPHQPMHLILQQHVGPRSDLLAADASTPDHVVMHVDWVRYYR